MAVLTDQLLRFITRILHASAQSGRPAYGYDPLLAQIEQVGDPQRPGTVSFAVSPSYRRKEAERIMQGYAKAGVVGAAAAGFAAGVVDDAIAPALERKVVALKEGFPSLPATTCATILRGLDCEIRREQVVIIYGSYGLSRATKPLAETVDFAELNRRADRLQQLIDAGSPEERQVVQGRYLAMHAYLSAPSGKRERAIAESGLNRSTFFFYWKAFERYGLLGLVDRARETFRRSKIGLATEAQLVIDKLRRPERPHAFFTGRLKSKGIHTDPSTVIKIFGKWNVPAYHCEFVHNLERLEVLGEEGDQPEEVVPEEDPVRWVSEYTGKDVWEFILNPNGMNAHLTACLKQNPLVKRARDRFLNGQGQRDDFWKYYDDEHVYADGTFPLVWPDDADTSQKEGPAVSSFRLNCAVKKNLKTGSYRCFGSSRPVESPLDVLDDYSHRWHIENGIKDLVRSYFLDHCPGSQPHQVDVHFFLITVCRLLYRLIERDLGEGIRNPDGSTKTLERMRDVLFRQGAAHIQLVEDTICVRFQDSFSWDRTELLKTWFEGLSRRHADGLQILDGLRLTFQLRVPRGEEHRNAFRKSRLGCAKRGGPSA